MVVHTFLENIYRRCNYRRIITEKILAEGGETFTGYIPVSRSRLAESLRVSVFTLNKVWKRFCDGCTETQYSSGGNRNCKLTNEDLKLKYALKNNKFFDESGIKLPNVGTRLYGHSPIGMRSVDLVRKRESRNMTFNLLVSLNGSEYFNLVDGATNTIEFLNFLSEAAEVANVTTRRPALDHGDMVVINNHAGPHFDGGDVLEEWLSEMGIELIYTAVYSPDLNPIESCFGKVKAMSVSTFSSSVPKSKMTFSAQITLRWITFYQSKSPGYVVAFLKKRA